MALKRQNVAGITLTSNMAKRDTAKSGFASIPMPRKTKLTSQALINKNGAHQV